MGYLEQQKFISVSIYLCPTLVPGRGPTMSMVTFLSAPLWHSSHDLQNSWTSLLRPFQANGSIATNQATSQQDAGRRPHELQKLLITQIDLKYHSKDNECSQIVVPTLFQKELIKLAHGSHSLRIKEDDHKDP
jgi:hypothetical protein